MVVGHLGYQGSLSGKDILFDWQLDQTSSYSDARVLCECHRLQTEKAWAINKSLDLLTGYTLSKSLDMVHHAGLIIIRKGSILPGKIRTTSGIRVKPRK